MYLVLVRKHFKLPPRTRYTLVLGEIFPHFCWQSRFILHTFLFSWSACAPFMFLVYGEAFLGYCLFLLSLICRILVSCCCYQACWCHRTLNRACRYTTSLHLNWCALVARPSIPLHHTFPGNHESSRESLSFNNWSNGLQMLLFRLALWFFRSAFFNPLADWLLTPHRDALVSHVLSVVLILFRLFLSCLR